MLRYVRRHWPKPKLRTFRRVETPPGAQSQVDWAEYPSATSWSPFRRSSWCSPTAGGPPLCGVGGETSLSWLQCHNESYRRLQGVAAVNRIDNVKTAIASGGGPWGEIHPLYRALCSIGGFSH